MDDITFRYLIYLAANMNLDMQLMDVVTTYLYGSLDAHIYMKIPDGFKILEIRENENRNMYSIKLQRSLYGLKQSGRMWFNRLSEFLLKREYINNNAYPCVFIKKSLNGFCIISVYVEDINIIGTRKEIEEASSCFNMEFEMKDLGKTKYCLDLQIQHLLKGIFLLEEGFGEILYDG